MSTCSTPVTSHKIEPTDQQLIKVRAFVVTQHARQPELWGCVFSRANNVALVQASFAAARVELTPIWNYNSSLFFEIPHVDFHQPKAGSTAKQSWLLDALQQMCTNLKPHQLTALQFLRKNDYMREAGINPMDQSTSTPSRGSILADDMGLGKILTTLTYVLATCDLAVEHHWADWVNRSAATLVVCPLSTLSNWEHEISIHFKDQAISYCIFHGPDQKNLTRQDLQSSLVVLTTYKMIGESGNRLVGNQLTVESLNLCWFRIVFDEAQ
ncbi:hypothetical protein PTTG_29467 [Puccinia triticina 1-1 BBBD Race 1]|uniref:SNF2_N domain-containing protein n=1 Tax=Puccinia triticina (isolate 1-1 / race 1 (BBBD)) TaxID=630390 RepID=A0A180G412_PUCT1|nr:hypothetical protein PTTG_29467 [Puccinia triticina 1-1 BBBD Race 1]